MTGEPFHLDPGDWIVCENGHRAYKARVRVGHQQAIRSADFEDEHGASPDHSSRLKCPTCGGRIVRPFGEGVAPWAIGRAKGEAT